MADEDLEQTIRENAAGPQQASGDSISVRQHSLKELIEADRYLASRKAMTGRGLGLRLIKIVPPGAV